MRPASWARISPLWKLILTRPGVSWEQTHVPRRACLLAGVGALLLLEERVEVALAAAVDELLTCLGLDVVAPPVGGQLLFFTATQFDHALHLPGKIPRAWTRLDRLLAPVGQRQGRVGVDALGADGLALIYILEPVVVAQTAPV